MFYFPDVSKPPCDTVARNSIPDPLPSMIAVVLQ